MPDLSPSLVIFTVVATGAVLAGLTRLILPASRRLALSTTIVAAVIGAAVAWIPFDFLSHDASPWLRMATGIGGAIVAVAVSTSVLLAYKRRRARGVADATIADLMAAGEGDRVEFKSTARWNTRSGAKDPRMEDEVVVTVAGFMNATGGTLLLGIDDDGGVHGLADDYAVVPGRDRDGFELWLRTMLAERLGRAVTADIGVTFAEVDGRDVCRVDVAPATGPSSSGRPEARGPRTSTCASATRPAGCSPTRSSTTARAAGTERRDVPGAVDPPGRGGRCGRHPRPRPGGAAQSEGPRLAPVPRRGRGRRHRVRPGPRARARDARARVGRGRAVAPGSRDRPRDRGGAIAREPVRPLYLYTGSPTAPFWAKLGFVPVAGNDVPRDIRAPLRVARIATAVYSVVVRRRVRIVLMRLG